MVSPKKPIKRKPWPEKHRQKLAQKCKEARPWENTTGPKTAAGKEKSAQNTLKHGLYSEAVQEIKRLLKAQQKYLQEVIDHQKT